jgi:hypothetical protein
MKVRPIAVVLSLFALLALAVPVLAQEKPQEPGAPAMGGPEMEAMMKAMMPGEEHKHLARLAGDWTFANKMWMAPGQPPSESGGTMHGEMILGGRYVQTEWKGTIMGMPFEGHGVDGYDNLAKKYVSSWIDNMGTGIMMSTGSCEDGGKKCTSTGEMMDPMTGKSATMRSVITWMSDSSFKMEMYGNGPDGSEMKMMELEVKRK